MGTLNITDLKPEYAEKRDFSKSHISLKVDGTLIYYKDGRLFSPRCERSDRFKHILDTLKANNAPNLIGEVFIDKPNANVFDVSRSENWKQAKFYPFDVDDKSLNFEQRQVLLKQLVSEMNSPNIVPLKEFKDFKEGWDYVKENNSEGLVIRDERNWFKVKILKETKVEIKEHEAGSEKGTFILTDGNRISGTSRDFVSEFNKLKSQGKKVFAEIEYTFMTEAGSYFQPRLRRLFEEGKEIT